MAKDPGSLSSEALAAYHAAFRPREIRHAMMQDYRAGSASSRTPLQHFGFVDFHSDAASADMPDFAFLMQG